MKTLSLPVNSPLISHEEMVVHLSLELQAVVHLEMQQLNILQTKHYMSEIIILKNFMNIALTVQM